MANPATRWEEQVDVEPARTLRVAGEQERLIAEFRAKVRAAGEQWAGARPAGLAELLCKAAADDPELARLARLGGQLLEDFVEGLSRNVAAVSGDLAADLIDGKRLPHDVLDRLAVAYVVVVARPVAERRAGDARDLAGRGVLCTRRSGVLVLLVPDGDNALLDRVTGELTDAESWVSTAAGPVTGLADAYAEAFDVLRLVVAGCRPCGVYGMTDVLVEHAIIRNDAVTARLAEMIRPLRENQVLWETLVALVRADFNRNQAARDLFIHRSTMDYRLQRIAKITGCDPVSGRGGQLLSAALIADAVA
ncbi:helix-turn-helix domain-containing protein [Lentzea sp. BCCO 10_0798]|uniref:Helix-turn-helix domain-containing protein n=1 Tax=Lentzea kristufekii TaxID=3095430 RepID=A0ABU4U885_9PSEU|nr:helix-turn-helix domain-containing protein [Lentzea sp. BCCO 10_0798]MDX8056161.1 helix-turn-helix domain-containing protein [Lentzea sp. BCCO 10_0798]